MRISSLLFVLAVVAIACVPSPSRGAHHVRGSHTLRRRLGFARTAASAPSPFQRYLQTGVLPEHDPFSQVRSVIDHLKPETPAAEEAPEATSFLQVSATAQAKKVRGFCEICILVVQMKQRGQPHLCAGLNANYYITCIEVLESLLRADKAFVYWIKNGCMHMDSTGPEIVRPCPALSICSWTPNLFAQPPSLVRDGVESLCPKDPKFLPTIPNEYKTLLSPQTTAVAGPTTQ